MELIFDSGTTVDYKFTTEVRVVPDYLPFACDLNRDGSLNLLDLHIFSTEWLASVPVWADIEPERGDGEVDFADFSLCGRNWQDAN